jgi:hypothetical protein
MTVETVPDESPVVAALRTLSIFGPDQAAAYREHYGEVARVLGPDIETRLITRTREWAATGSPGLRVMTGNAGTGKTGCAETFCQASGGELPRDDGLVRIADGRWVIKDLSGVPNGASRAAALRRAIELAASDQVLVCANEGVLREALGILEHDGIDLMALLDAALRQGASRSGTVLIVNLNRQRLTSEGVWQALVRHLVRDALWTGCLGCPFGDGACPMRANAEALRNPEVADGVRVLVRFASGEAVPTLRELLAILARGITGGLSCGEVKQKFRDRGADYFDARHAYFSLAFGDGDNARRLDQDVRERSPLLGGMRAAGLGDIADLEVDDWLRDASGAPLVVQRLAGAPPDDVAGSH